MTDELRLLLDSLDRQRTAIRTACGGLDRDQLRSRPSASELSLGGLLTHVVQGEEHFLLRVQGRPTPQVDESTWHLQFVLGEDTELAELLSRWERAAADIASWASAEPDLARVVAMPEDFTRWLPDPDETSVRGLLLHVVEELARHAGHADVVRESLDGATVASLAGRG